MRWRQIRNHRALPPLFITLAITFQTPARGDHPAVAVAPDVDHCVPVPPDAKHAARGCVHQISSRTAGAELSAPPAHRRTDTK